MFARHKLLIAVTCCLLSSMHANGQDVSPEDRAKLTQAQQTADAFVKEFRRTLNFDPVWRKFRAENFACRLIKSDLVTSISDEEKQRLGIPLLETAYVALMNYFYLKGVHDLSAVRIDSGNSDEQITPRDILRIEQSNVYLKVNGKPPETARDIQQYIVELNRLSRLYRKHLPRNFMRSAAWNANMKYFLSRGGVTHLNVGRGRSDFCVPDGQKYFIVDRGLFYFYLIEENGRMKVVELAVDLN